VAEDLGERSEDATPKRMREAREEGNVAKSMDATAALTLLVATLALAIGLAPLLTSFGSLIRETLLPEHNIDAARPEALDAVVRPALTTLGLTVAPALGLALLTAFLASIWQVGFHPTSKPLVPKLERMSPLSGFKRVFGSHGIIKTGFDLTKLVAVAVVATLAVMDAGRALVTLPAFEPQMAAKVIGGLIFDLALRVVAVLLVLGIVDYAVQRWKHARDLRMTKQQVREEYKQTEGDPEVKRRRMQIQRQIAMQRIQTAVPKADVIVTNPEHISIAIAYDAESMRAPRVVAKGADHLAMRIRQIAQRHGIPIVERKPLARALYRQVEVGQEIPPDHYKAVAEILAYVYRLDGAAGRRRPAAGPTRGRSAASPPATVGSTV
jgi:flagellar biosynthetic protein FlhB